MVFIRMSPKPDASPLSWLVLTPFGSYNRRVCGSLHLPKPFATLRASHTHGTLYDSSIDPCAVLRTKMIYIYQSCRGEEG